MRWPGTRERSQDDVLAKKTERTQDGTKTHNSCCWVWLAEVGVTTRATRQGMSTAQGQTWPRNMIGFPESEVKQRIIHRPTRHAVIQRLRTELGIEQATPEAAWIGTSRHHFVSSMAKRTGENMRNGRHNLACMQACRQPTLAERVDGTGLLQIPLEVLRAALAERSHGWEGALVESVSRAAHNQTIESRGKIGVRLILLAARGKITTDKLRTGTAEDMVEEAWRRKNV